MKQGIAVFLLLAPLSSGAVVNGHPITESVYPAVVMLKDPAFPQDPCTGTFVGDDTLLTASHCVQHFTMFYRAEKPKMIIFSNRYHRTGDDALDLGLLVFSKAIAPSVLDIAVLSPPPGAPVTFVGYGCANAKNKTGKGVKRQGENDLDHIYLNYGNEIGANMVFTKAVSAFGAPNGKAYTCDGDSGGPMIYDNQIIGVTSSGGGLSSQHADVTSVFAQEFFQESLEAGADISSLKKDPSKKSTALISVRVIP